jgi:electron transfer flavoprotein beta subunit
VKIYVCLKHVPDTGAYIALKGPLEFDESVKFVINPFDEYAVEEALRLVEAAGEGEVVVVTVGKPAAEATVRAALGLGAHRGILVETESALLDPGLTARALQLAIESDGEPALILTGKQSVDAEGSQVPYRLAADMDLPVVTGVVDFELAGETAVVERELDDGSREVLEVAVPCVIGATKGLNEPRGLRLSQLMKARKREVRHVEVAELDLAGAESGAELLELVRAPEKSEASMIEGDPQEMVEELVSRLRTEAKVL